MASPYPTKELKVLRGHQGAVLCVRYNADGNYCVSGGADKTIRLWFASEFFYIEFAGIP